MARHTLLAAWALCAATIAVIASLSGQSLLAASALGLALGGFLVLLPMMFDPFPAPLTRQQWPLRLPILRDLARNRHWANPFYVEQLTFQAPFRPQFCAQQLAASVLGFPWLPITKHNIAGRIRGKGFVLKRLTWWHNGMRPTASGKFEDSPPGTRVELSIAAPAIGAYFFLVLFIVGVVGFGTLTYGVAAGLGEGRTGPVTIVFVIFAGLLLTFAVIALWASPVALPFAKAASEADHFKDFLGDVLGADLVSRE